VTIFPLRCARVREHTGRETSAQKKTVPSKMFLYILLWAHRINKNKENIEQRWISLGVWIYKPPKYTHGYCWSL